MVVRKMESPVYEKRRREALPGKGVERSSSGPNGFEQYLLDAFEGEVVKEGNRFASHVSPLQKENIIRLSQL